MTATEQKAAEQAVARAAVLATRSPDGLDEKALYLNGATSTDADADARAIVARIMAGSVDEAFAGPGSLLSAENVIGTAFTLTDVEYRESDIEGSPGVYALLHITPWGTEGNVLVTCGARNVMATAFRAKQGNALPRGPVTIVEGKQTRKGFTPLWLQDMDPKAADAAKGIVTIEEPF